MKTIFLRLRFWKLFRRDSLCRRAVGALVVFSFTLNVMANPTGMTVQRGNASFSINGSTLTVRAGNNTVLNWQNFNIANGETTIFNQPSSSSIVWNRINNNQGASQIYGSLQANGVVVLLNSSGFYFGPNSFVSAAGLVVSTANCMPPQNSGGAWVFNGPPPLASIVNYGQIKIGNGGDCFFIADKIENHGNIEAPGGNIGFAAGQTVTLSERPDGRGMSMNVTLPQGSVDNYGNVIADGGTIALNARVVNQNGLLQANSVRDQNGVIELVASDTLNLGADSKILAGGDDSTSGSAGGTVTLKSGNVFSDADGSAIFTTGGANGGNGGNVEVSAPNIASLYSAMDARSQAGFLGGEFLLDPVNIILGTTGSGSVPANGTVSSGDSGNGAVSGTLNLNVNTAFANKNFSNIKLQATGNITLSANTTWDLSSSTGQAAGQLTLQAGGNITLGSGATIVDGGGWSVSLAAGYDFVNNVVKQNVGSIFMNGGNGLTGNGSIQLTDGAAMIRAGSAIQIGSGNVTTAGGSVTWQTGGDITFGNGSQINVGGAGNVTLDAGYNFASSAVTSGAGNIYLNGGTGKTFNGTIQATAGQVDLEAGQNVLVGSGAVRTVGGGGIVVKAAAGSVNTGTLSKGYNFLDAQSGPIYSVDPSLGGISTAAGGNVSITAGLDVTSRLPTGTSTLGDAGSGAFGSAPGDVTITAGRDVIGHYVVANGTGAIIAGNNAGAPTDSGQLALSLINGGWKVTAGNNINLSEVRNPNGIFNKSGSYYNAVNYPYYDKHYFDYGLSDYVSLNAANAIALGGGSLPRNSGSVESAIPIIFPGKLDMVAGTGGINLLRDITLFPSAQGGLTLKTTGGGSLNGSSGGLTSIVVSDSGKNQYQPGAFGQGDHAQVPVHLNNPTPITLDVSGDMNNVQIVAPEAAQLKVGGDMINSRFLGQNLHAGDVTSITVAGDIKNRNEFTYVNINYNPPLNDLELAYAPTQSALDPYLALEKQLHYDPVTKRLTFQGKMTTDQYQALTSLQIQLAPNGVPEVDSFGNPITHTVHILDTATATSLYSGSQDVITSGISTGYVIGGGGTFNINARNLDLGTTKGIQSVGPLNNQALANYFTGGAAINVNVSENLDMFSAAICSLNGGGILVQSGGDMTIGSLDFKGNDALARGIFTSTKADVTVIAVGDIDINGSRIAAYDGGNVTAISLDGNINAGGGGIGFVQVDKVTTSGKPDPITGRMYSEDLETIPGSGIITTTFYTSKNQIGNILVETPNGGINAGTGGIIQLPLNQVKSDNATVTLLAGYQQSPAGVANAVFSQHNLVTDQTLAGNGQRLQLVDDSGRPVKDAAGHPIYVDQLLSGLANTIFSDNTSISANTLAQTLSERKQKLKLVDASNNAVLDSSGKVTYVTQLTDSTAAPRFVIGRNIDVSGSGVIGSNVKLQATGAIDGVIFARGNIDLAAVGNAHVTALAQGNINASAGGSLSGTIIGVGGVSASGGSIDATVLSQNASVNGGSTGDTFAPGTAANATASAMSAASAKAVDTSGSTVGTDDPDKKKGISLAAKVSRVTVILPTLKKVSEASTKEPKL